MNNTSFFHNIVVSCGGYFYEKVLVNLLRMKLINNNLLQFAVLLHNFSYRLISRLATLANNGTHPKHRLMDYHQFFITNIDRHDVVLDVGCGYGFLTRDLALKAKKVVAIDLNAKYIKIAKDKYCASNITYINGNATRYIFNQKFDVIILSNVLEHIEKRILFLSKIKRLAPKILIRVPMINRDWVTLYKKEKGFEYRLDRTHYIEYTMESFQEEVEEAGIMLDQVSIQFGEIWAIAK